MESTTSATGPSELSDEVSATTSGRTGEEPLGADGQMDLSHRVSDFIYAPKISLSDKIFNFISIVIPHLQTIIVDLTPNSKFKVVSQNLYESLDNFKKKLVLIDLIIGKDKDLKSQNRQSLEKVAKDLQITVEAVLEGVNEMEVEKILDYSENYMFLPAFKKWRSLASEISLAKRMIVFNRKLDLMFFCFPLAMLTDRADIWSQDPNGQVWREIDSFTTHISVYNPDKMKELWHSQNEFLYIVQAAQAKATKSLLNLKTLEPDQISELMKVSFFDYESWCNKRKLEGFKSVWRKNHIPKLSSKFWRIIFKYMLNKESVFEDVELFIAYPNKDCIRDYWNMAETYAANVSRRLMYGPINFRKRVFLKTNILNDHLKNISKDPNKVCHLIDTKWKFLGKHKNAKLSPEEMFPKDLYFDNDKEERIGINILCHADFGFFELVDDYCKKNSLAEVAKKKTEVTNLEQQREEETKSKKSKKQVTKVGWMFSKMVGIIDMFKEKKEPNSSEGDSSDEEKHHHYRTFADDKSPVDQASKEARKSENPRAKQFEFHNKYEQSFLEIQSQIEHNLEDQLALQNDANLKTKFDQLLNANRSVKSSTLETIKPTSNPKPKGEHLSEGERADTKPKENPSPGSAQKDLGASKQSKNDPKELFKKIIIHIHGGGFMAMSSTYHETYLRLFANELERPVFSIDYRLAPQTQFPNPLHDCIRGYFWVKQFVEEVVGTTLESVVLIGDSAGGNLSFALTYWLIENSVRGPDLLIGCYSALRLEIKAYTPSFFRSFEEYFLSYAGLWACCRQYLPEAIEGEDLNDKYISPVRAEADLLRRMPRTRMMVPMDDPLADDQFRLAYKMFKAGSDIKVTAFKDFIHGMLSMNRNEVLPVKIFQDEVIKAIREVFDAELPAPAQDSKSELAQDPACDPDSIQKLP